MTCCYCCAECCEADARSAVQHDETDEESRKLQVFSKSIRFAACQVLREDWCHSSGWSLVGPPSNWCHIPVFANCCRNDGVRWQKSTLNNLLKIKYWLFSFAGLQIIYTLDEVAFIQNLVFYIQSAYRIPVFIHVEFYWRSVFNWACVGFSGLWDVGARWQDQPRCAWTQRN